MATATSLSRMIKGRTTFALLLSIVLASNQVESLMNGAPAMACINLRPLHSFNLAKPASASQFFVSQSTLSYKPGENVTVDLMTHSSERHFRGFIVQAYDPSSGSKIGHFVENQEAKPIDSCSAATHRNNKNKRQVSITWLPSNNNNDDGSSSSLATAITTTTTTPEFTAQTPTVGHHQVRFKASIVVSYEEFYTGFESSENKFDKFTFANGNEQLDDSSSSSRLN